jgi:UDP-glucose 4-epimerase|tara:strand:+ start:3272 stop:4126 length:855 start_codon:yes stop_codon:yes gene_type:complete
LKKNSRIVILGGNSFVLSNFVNLLKINKIKFLLIFKKNIDLTNTNSIKKLSKILKKNDKVVFSSAIAPAKNLKMLLQNLEMCQNVFEVLKKKKIKYILYVSSDAVYSDSKKPLTEKSETKPDNFHGAMHLMREKILKLLNIKLCIVRPTLVYGTDDPHNGYGTNQFIRLAQSKKNISLFGKGEERRDHIHVNDVGNAIYFLVKKNYVGTVNLVSGKVVSFHKIAEKIKNLYNVKLRYVKRKGVMPHNGYRAFNNTLLKKILTNRSKIKNVLEWINIKEKYKRKI